MKDKESGTHSPDPNHQQQEKNFPELVFFYAQGFQGLSWSQLGFCRAFIQCVILPASFSIIKTENFSLTHFSTNRHPISLKKKKNKPSKELVIFSLLIFPFLFSPNCHLHWDCSCHDPFLCFHLEQNYPKEQSVYTAASLFPSILLKPSLVLSKPLRGLLTHFGGLNENGPPQANIFEYMVPSWWDRLGRIRRCGFVGEGLSVGVVLGVSFPVALPPVCGSGCSSLSHDFITMPTAMLGTMGTWVIRNCELHHKSFLLVPLAMESYCGNWMQWCFSSKSQLWLLRLLLVDIAAAHTWALPFPSLVHSCHTLLASPQLPITPQSLC